MEKTNKHFWQLASALMFVLIVFAMGSCHDDKVPDQYDEEEAERIYEELKTQSLITNLCEMDTLHDGTTRYVSRWGRLLNQITPTIYYVGVESLEEAESTYFSILSALQEDADSPVTDYDIRQGNCHLSFIVENKPDEIARIDIECPDLKEYLTSIVFIPLEHWPENDASSPFTFLSLWKNKAGDYYLCVREAKGDRGIMITFDGGYEEEKFTTYTYWQGNFSLWKGTASIDAIECLCRALKYNNDRYSKMLAKLNAQSNRGTKGNRFISLFEKNSVILDRNYVYSRGLWWAHYCYYLTIYKTTINSDYSWSHWGRYFKHKSTPVKDEASHSFYFEPNFDKSGWTCIFK